MTLVAYLAGPVDQAGGHDQPWRTAVDSNLRAQGFIVFRPWEAFSLNAAQVRPDHRVEQVNRHALGLADVLIAMLPGGVPTIGTPMEIEYALQQGIPVVVLTNNTGSFSLSDPRIQLARDPVEAVASAWMLANVTRPLEKLSEAYDEEILIARDPDHLPKEADTPIPTRAYRDDAGLDLYVSVQTTIPVGKTLPVPTGIKAQLPDWAWGFITGRSSTLVKRKLMVQSAVIDTGWRGPLYVYVTNLGGAAVTVYPGERLAQMIVQENSTRRVTLREVAELDPHDRGHNGFGSSGS